MPPKYSGKYFTFINVSTALTPSLKQVLGYIEENLGDMAYEHDIYFKAKSIVTELLTNGFKHAGAETVNISVDIDPDHITIIKTDYGIPFKPVTNGTITGTKTRLTFDIMHHLYAVTEPDNQVRFIVEEVPIENMDVNNIGEHFGLLIITKCSEEFVYHFNMDTKLNSFTAKVRLPNPPAP